MTNNLSFVTGGPIFDGTKLHQDVAAVFRNGVFETFCAPSDVENTAHCIDLGGRILTPGFVDLQVNGGGGVMLNDDPSLDTVRTIAQAHAALGVVGFLPTLISDTASKVTQAISAVAQAVEAGVPNVLGLHLEGPHLSVERKGAHDASFIRPMTETDLAELIEAKSRMPVLKVTVAPENVTVEQVATLSKADVIVSLGHTNAKYEVCKAYAAGGASCVTHLFNAMSQLESREPGLVGTFLTVQDMNAGLIADGIHVHAASMSLAWSMKGRSSNIFLVSDAMAVAGTDLNAFCLGGRKILRQDGQLRLTNGTLAGADLDLLQAVRVLVNTINVDLADALAAATRVPGQITGTHLGQLLAGKTMLSRLNMISEDLSSLDILK